MSKIKKGDYVLASRWNDHDPNDPWAVGFVRSIDMNGHVEVGEMDGADIPSVGSRLFRYAKKITPQYGREWVKDYSQRGPFCWPVPRKS